MFQFQNVWLPDGEQHFQAWMAKNGELVDGKGTYQIKKWRSCIPWIKQWRNAVDVGAHVGLWSMQMVGKFRHVHAFEPVAQFRSCYLENVPYVAPWKYYTLYAFALGAESANVMMEIPSLNGGIDSGGTHVYCGNKAPESRGNGEGVVKMETLDSLELRDVDFIKIDCEGYEHHVIEGARETLMNCKPCVIVEQKPHKLKPNFGIEGAPAVALLLGMGAKQRTLISGDYIMSWD